MLLYRYMPYEYWVDTVRSGWFAAQRPSRFADMFEGNIIVNESCRLCSSALDSQFSILCLNKKDGTSKNSEFQLWSQYADGHKGVRILVDLPEGLFDRLYMMEHVSYESFIPRLQLDSVRCIIESLTVDVVSQWELYAKLFLHKHQSWMWENEFRVVIMNTEVTDLIQQRNTNTAPRHNSMEKRWFFRLPANSILGVDFGARVNECGDWFKMVQDVGLVKGQMKNLHFGVMRITQKQDGIERIDFDEYLRRLDGVDSRN